MVVHHKQIQRKRNRERETERYKRKREKRALKQRTVRHIDYPNLEMVFPESGDTVTISSIPKEVIQQPVKFNWFEKFLLWIKNIFRREI